MADSWAVKYRPQNFSDIVGNEKIGKILKNAVARDNIPAAVFLAGTRGSGKCFDENQLVLTAKGLIKGKDLKPEVYEEGFTPFRFPLISKNKKLEETSQFYSNGEKETLCIKTTKGFEVVVTPNHPLYVFDGEQFLWKEAQDITENDFLTLPKDTNVYGDFEKHPINFIYVPNSSDTTDKKDSLKDRKIPEFMTESLAELMGLFVGDCCSSKTQNYSWKFESDIGVDPDMEEKVHKLYKDVFGLSVNTYPDNNFKTKSLRSNLTVFPFNYKKGCYFLKFLGVKETTSAFKEVPWSILQSGKNIQQAFIRGLFEADGWCYNSNISTAEVGYASASKILVQQIQVMLINMGIIAAVRERWNEQYQKNYFYLSIEDGLSLEKFKEIGFLSERKNNNLSSFIFRPETQPRVCIQKDKRLFIKIFEESSLPIRSRNKDNKKNKKYVYGNTSAYGDNFSGLSETRINRILAMDDTISEDTKDLLIMIRDDYYLQRVVSVEDTGVRYTIDFEMPESHSFILNGVSSHNTTSGRLYAKALCCENPGEDGEPCNCCSACKDIVAKRYPDVIEIDAASENSVQGIRELIKTLNYLPTHGKYKVVILDEVHSLSQAATNALLKTLEEPPEFVKFVFCTTEPQKVLDTIRSRCLMFHFKDITTKDIVKRLQFIADQENVNIDTLALNFIAKNSNGGMRDAIMLLQQAVLTKPEGELIKSGDIMEIVGFVSITDIQQLFLALKQGTVDDVLNWLDTEQFAPIDILTSSINFLETIIFIKQGVSPSAFVPKDQIPGIMSLSSVISFSEVMLLFREFRSIIYDLKNLTLVNTQTLFRMRILDVMEKLNTTVQTPEQQKLVITEQKQSFVQRVKLEYNLTRIPIPV